MNALVLFAILAAAMTTMVYWGIARTFVYVWIPATLFFFLVPQVGLPGLPNLVASTAVGYAVLLLAPMRWAEISRIRMNIVDWLILLLMLPPTISVFFNNEAWDAISRMGELFFRWVLPYFMARIAFTDPMARKHALTVVCTCTIVLGCMAVVEARLRPYVVSRTMEKLRIAQTANDQVFTRFGLMRAQTTLGHPIDLGNCGVILGSLVLALTPIAGRRWNEPLPIAGVLAAGAMVVGAVSFTGLLATAFAFGLLFFFARPILGPRLVLPAALFVILAITVLLTQMLEKEISIDRPEDTLEASVWIRLKIVQGGWARAQEAGLWGEGQYIQTQGIGTGSIDNSYVLFAMMFGYAYLASWVVLVVALGWMGGKTLALARTTSERVPIAAVCAGIIAIVLAMYTVFFGFVYSMLILVLMGFLSSMWQMMRDRQRNAPALSYGQPAAMQMGGMAMGMPQTGYGAPMPVQPLNAPPYGARPLGGPR